VQDFEFSGLPSEALPPSGFPAAGFYKKISVFDTYDPTVEDDDENSRVHKTGS
jgi:hypothetical protein